MAGWILTAPIWGITTYMPVAMTDGGVFLFGLVDTTRSYTEYQAMDGMVTPEWLPFAIMNVIGFYYGSAAMKR
jgi:hypothetical protein